MSNQGYMLRTQPSIEDMVSEALDIIREAQEIYAPKRTYAMVSGGNDSITMLHLVRPYIDAAVHINTGIGIQETTQFVRDTCVDWGIPLIELVTPPETYVDILMRANGFPGPALHATCYHRLKSERLHELQRDYSKRGEKLLLLSGVREHESRRRMRGIGSKEHTPAPGGLSRCVWAAPLVHWTSLDMSRYGRGHLVPRSLVADLLHKSGECLCGSFARPGELDEISVWFPSTATYIRSLEERMRSLGKRYCKWGWRAPSAQDMAMPSPGPLCSDCQLRLIDVFP